MKKIERKAKRRQEALERKIRYELLSVNQRLKQARAQRGESRREVKRLLAVG